MTETSHRTSVSASGGDVSVYASRVSVMFSALDNRDSDTVIGHLTDDVVVHLGNADPIQGGEAFIALTTTGRCLQCRRCKRQIAWWLLS